MKNTRVTSNFSFLRDQPFKKEQNLLGIIYGIEKHLKSVNEHHLANLSLDIKELLEIANNLDTNLLDKNHYDDLIYKEKARLNSAILKKELNKNELINVLKSFQSLFLLIASKLGFEIRGVIFDVSKYKTLDPKSTFKKPELDFNRNVKIDESLVKKILNKINEHRNIVLIGAAGTGKTTLINEISYRLKQEGKNIIQATPTNVSAKWLNNARTINATFGYGICRNVKHYYNWPERNVRLQRFANLYRDTDIFIIDEISMISSYTLELIDFICRLAFDKDKPFGGKQFILVGDPYQLPPIFTAIDANIYKLDKDKRFFFKGNAFSNGNFYPVVLEKIYRQNDIDFIKFLNEVRSGHISKETEQYVQTNLSHEDKEEQGVFIVSRNMQVDAITNYNFNKLIGESRKYKTEIKNIDYELYKQYYPKLTSEQEVINNIIKDESIRADLEFKVGMQVMTLNKNHDYEKNEIGIIKAMDENSILVEFSNDRISWITYETKDTIDIQHKLLYNITHMPLIPAYAFTCHRAQGMTLDKLTVDCDNIFEDGQLYVALSRARTPEGLTINNWEKVKIKPYIEIDEFIKTLKSQQ